MPKWDPMGYGEGLMPQIYEFIGNVNELNLLICKTCGSIIHSGRKLQHDEFHSSIEQAENGVFLR